jgi:alpha-N-arabinofuranosidase
MNISVMKYMIKVRMLFIAALFFSVSLFAQKKLPIIVDADKPTAAIQPTMWGVFFEDINFAADGGLYAEMVKNRSFEFYKPRTGWKIDMAGNDSSHFVIHNRGAQNEDNPRFARVTLSESTGKLSVSNYGFRGMGFKYNNKYNFSILARLPEESNIKLRIELMSENGKVTGSAEIIPKGREWKKYEASLIAGKSDTRGYLRIWFEGTGGIDIDMVSLFPADTWKNRPNGLRADLVQLLADMNPGFIRFPGGCIVEGYNLDLRYQWKKTIGDIAARKTIINRWNTEFAHRLTADYYQSFGLGFYEYFQLAEDIGAEPLPVLNCGMACQFNSAEVIDLDQIDPYVQDALDLIEFANGAPDTKWGEIRAQMGHPAPFNMKYLGIGNEQWGPQYFERYRIFEKAIREKYPDIRLVSGTGPSPDGDLFNYAQKILKDMHPYVVDEHYYRHPEWFRNNATRYDSYDRNGYKVFAGEYAAQSNNTASPENRNTWECALSEAAFMTGLERNADVVYMCSYAPLFANADAWQWTPDLIWFDNIRSFGTADYYVQKLFSVNKGSEVLPVVRDDKPLTGQNGLYASAVFDKDSNEIILKLVNTDQKAQIADIVLLSSKKPASLAKMTVLKSEDLNTVNSLEQPARIRPVESEVTLKGKNLSPELAGYSFSVIRIKVLK